MALWFAGCATVPAEKSTSNEKSASPPSNAKPLSEDSRLGIRNQGYSLLYQLLSDEKNLSKVLLIKKEERDVGELVRKISNVSGDAVKQMDAFAKTDGHLHYHMEGLPSAEKETRDLIGKTREKEVLTKGGEKFDLRILLTQSEALTYGAHLAIVVQSHEQEPTRKAFLGDLSRQLQELHQSLIDLMHSRWRMPEKR
jgi:hypothetical protein